MQSDADKIRAWIARRKENRYLYDGHPESKALAALEIAVRHLEILEAPDCDSLEEILKKLEE